ncbi:sensor histidine kinase [Kitasatospora sp. NPDC004745]|uniref:sensor histidine kinase n=1 Tax=Kitasatospora sp. NPDC004745 TaxID=3364019 RepID=UPI0036BB1580
MGAVRAAAGIALGAVTACAAPAVLATAALTRRGTAVVRLAELDQRRVAALLDTTPAHPDQADQAGRSGSHGNTGRSAHAGAGAGAEGAGATGAGGGVTGAGGGVEVWRARAYLWARLPVGLLGGGALVLLGAGAWTVAGALGAWLSGHAADGMRPTWPVAGYLLAAALLLLFLDLAGLAAVAELERRLVRRHLGPDELALMRRRIDELAATRSGIVEAVDAERRRIERDLHDGLQQRLIVVAMLLGRARRKDSEELYRQARHENEQALEELRQVAWRIYPASLDQLGLREALAVDAERCPVPVHLHGDLTHRPAPAIETAAYFAVREALTNAAKHARAATRIDVTIHQDAHTVRVSVRDDGNGGADPNGTGLAGLARRLGALDGHLTIDSPPGGPTHLTAELPCAS